LGLPDEKRLKKACNQSRTVVLYAYGERAAKVWWSQVQNKVSQFSNLSVRYIDDELLAQLVSFCQRNMVLQATLQDDAIWLSDAQNNVEIHFEEWKDGNWKQAVQ